MLTESITDVAVPYARHLGLGRGFQSFHSFPEMESLHGILRLAAGILDPDARYLEIGTYLGAALVQVRAMFLDLELHSLNVLPEQVKGPEREILPVEDIGRVADEHHVVYAQHYGNSLDFDFEELGKFNAIFVDGCHLYEYVKSDGQNAHKILLPGGVIIWHDFKDKEPGTQQAIRELDQELFEGKLTHVEDTWLVYWKEGS